LALPADRLDRHQRAFHVDEPNVGMVVGMLAAETEAVFSEPLSNVAGLAHVEHAVC
jgi:hypothetical protein